MLLTRIGRAGVGLPTRRTEVIVKNLNSGSRIILKSNVGCEIQKINVFKDNFLLAHTPESLLLGDLTSCQLSEIPWVPQRPREVWAWGLPPV